MKLIRTFSLALAILMAFVGGAVAAQTHDVIAKSRASTVRITSQALNSSGTGFFIGHQYVATCFHVVAAVQSNGNNVNFNIPHDIVVRLPTGEEVNGEVVTIPSNSDPSPLASDFAIIKLKSVPNTKYEIAKLAQPKFAVEVGSEVIFSGYPLGAPGMVTHRGMISGDEPNLPFIFVQAPINKGNSGGALFDDTGLVIGVVSNREGGISKGLAELSVRIEESAKSGSVQIMGVDPLQATRGLIQTLDEYISTGMGYARRIEPLQIWISSHPDVLT